MHDVYIRKIYYRFGNGVGSEGRMRPSLSLSILCAFYRQKVSMALHHAHAISISRHRWLILGLVSFQKAFPFLYLYVSHDRRRDVKYPHQTLFNTCSKSLCFTIRPSMSHMQAPLIAIHKTSQAPSTTCHQRRFYVSCRRWKVSLFCCW